MNGYLTDDAGRKSAIRLYGLIALLAGIVLAFLATMTNSDLGGWLATMMIGTAFTGKVLQKQIEEDRQSAPPVQVQNGR